MNPSSLRIIITIISFTCTLTTLQTSACMRRDDPEYADYWRQQESKRREEGKTQLITALSKNDYETVKKYKEFLNSTLSLEKGTPLCFVIDCGNEAMAPYLVEHGADIKDALKHATPKVLKYLLDHNIQNISPSFFVQVFKKWPLPDATNKELWTGIAQHGEEQFNLFDEGYDDNSIWIRSKPEIPELYKILLTHNWVRYIEKKKGIERLRTVLLVHKKDSIFATLPKEILYYLLSFLPDTMWTKTLPPLGNAKNNVIALEITRRLDQVKKFGEKISIMGTPRDRFCKRMLDPRYVSEIWEKPIAEQVEKDLVTPWAAVKVSEVKKRKLEEQA